jgi:hypothetical protein
MMPEGFPNKPKIIRGAFVEYGFSLPPLLVVFQFNPVQLSRNRTLSYSAPSEEGRNESLREFHRREVYQDLSRLQKDQQVGIQEEAISFEIRLDATDKLDEGDRVTEQLGIAPQLATLEMMVHPKEEGLLGAALDSLLLGSANGFSFTRRENPPMILFIWGPKRVLPVNINSLNVTETEFSTSLDPIRATVAVSLTVIEGKNPPYLYSKVLKEATSALNLANVADIATVVIPG